MQAFCIKKVDTFIRHFLLAATIPFSNNIALTNTLRRLNIHFTHVKQDSRLCRLIFMLHRRVMKPAAACKVGNQFVNFRYALENGQR